MLNNKDFVIAPELYSKGLTDINGTEYLLLIPRNLK